MCMPKPPAPTVSPPPPPPPPPAEQAPQAMLLKRSASKATRTAKNQAVGSKRSLRGTNALRIDLNVPQPGGKGLNVPLV